MKFSSLSSLNFTVLLLEVYKTSLLDIIGSRQWKKAHAVSCVSLLFGGLSYIHDGKQKQTYAFTQQYYAVGRAAACVYV